jgi:hypothetical protein
MISSATSSWKSLCEKTNVSSLSDRMLDTRADHIIVDVYETPTPPPATAPGLDDDGAADDRIAEEFKREFLEAMAQKQHKKKPASGAKKDEEVLKGPKLGGSRNARAAMRDLMLKKERESKK